LAAPMKITVYVRLKTEVLDPQGRAVQKALSTLGIEGVKDVRIGKLIEIELDRGVSPGPELDARVRKMCDELLANPVIEDYEIKLG
jgi:phosphoribosylformylglycinamidine synthase subunit PurS